MSADELETLRQEMVEAEDIMITTRSKAVEASTIANVYDDRYFQAWNDYQDALKIVLANKEPEE